MAKRFWFWPIYGVLLAGIVLVGAEYIASGSVPSWPARDLRPVPIEGLKATVNTVFADTPELVPSYNDWAVRDRPRSVARPPDVQFRSVLVGDSFLEGYYIPAALAELVERRWAARGLSGMEAINLAIAATGPPQYYARIKKVALALDPDVVAVFVYAGNDMVDQPFDPFSLPPLVDELPAPSILGSVAPRTTWLLANRLRLSEMGRKNKDIPGEEALISEWTQQPSAEPIARVARHMRQHYYPKLSEEAISEILLRGDGRLHHAARHRGHDQEYIGGWLLSGIIDWETGSWPVPHNADEAVQMVGNDKVGETLSWLQAMDRLVKAGRKRLMIALIPVGTVDPDYAEFWRPWPRYYSFSMSADARHRRLAAALRQNGLWVVDLREVLDGVRGTYRLTDGHWTDRGTQLSAERVADALLSARQQLIAAPAPAGNPAPSPAR
jgi:SGNH hydrolase-like domain, acetyltransferase AlgX